MATTLRQLREQARRYINEIVPQGGTAVTWGDEEVDNNVNLSQTELWLALAKKDEAFALREAEFELADGIVDYNYPPDILGRNIVAVHAFNNASELYYTVKKSTLDQVYAEGRTSTSYPNRYTCLDAYFKVGPPPAVEALPADPWKLLVTYNKQPAPLILDTDPMESDDEFKEVIALGAAIRCLMRTGDDYTSLTQKWTEMFDRAVSAVIPEDVMDITMDEKY